MCDITDEEFERLYLPVCINYDNYLKEFVITEVIAFYIADNFYKKILSKAPLYNHINSAIDIFNIRCDIDKLIPSIKKILKSCCYIIYICQSYPNSSLFDIPYFSSFHINNCTNILVLIEIIPSTME